MELQNPSAAPGWNISLCDAKIWGKVNIYDQDVETSIDRPMKRLPSYF